MLPILIVGFSAVFGLATLSPPPRTANEDRNESSRAPDPGGTPRKPQAATAPDARHPRRVCAIQVLRADPSIDRGMVIAIERPLDPGMVAPTRCASE